MKLRRTFQIGVLIYVLLLAGLTMFNGAFIAVALPLVVYLATVVLYTAAGASEIPALDDEVAGEVRDRIAGLANLNQQL